MKRNTFLALLIFSSFTTLPGIAQQYNWVSSTRDHYWQQKSIKTKKASGNAADVIIDEQQPILTFGFWGTCFNELGWDALNLLPQQTRDSLFQKLFSPTGDLRFGMGRFSMNANDYSRSWYSCDSVAGDFDLKYFNIERDKTTLIPYIKEAQKQNPAMTFWISPWSPPAWMKVNNYYSVRSDAKYNQMPKQAEVILYQGTNDVNKSVFPQQLALNDYLVQDPRYLKSYASYFCKFIDAYKAQGIPIKTVMYQNEAYSYTIYPGCAWTAEGTIRFNTEYLAPALQEKHPDVQIYMGTINTNRYDLIDKILSDSRMPGIISGVGFQWEGGQILPAIRKKYPQYQYMCSGSECGWGSLVWGAAEHTFSLMNHYIGNGCTGYTFWNAILTGEGASPWGWKQNALIRVNAADKTATLTPEYYAVKHYSHYVSAGTKLVGWKPAGADKKPVMVFVTPQGKRIIVAGNFADEPQQLVVKTATGTLEAMLKGHSLNTFENE